MSTNTQPSPPVRLVVAGVGALGALSALAALALSLTVWSDYGNLEPPPADFWQIAALAVAFTTVGQMVYVRVRHGGTDEELNFFEVALAAGLLLLSPAMALLATLTGVLIGEVVIRRGEWIKVGFNLGTYATATSAMVVTYNAMAGGTPPFETQSILSLVLASFVFTAVNLALYAFLRKVTVGASPRIVLLEEWRLSSLMALGSVGVGSVAAVCVLEEIPAVLPFAFLPALALWYAYGAAAQHAEAVERNKWLVSLGGLLAEHGQGGNNLEESATAIRRIVGAPEVQILQPTSSASERDLASERILSSVWSDSDQRPRPLTTSELPERWSTGVVTRLDLGTSNRGAILIGSTDPYRPSRIAGRTRGWSLEEADAPVLGALVAAVGSAMRAGAAFNAMNEETAKMKAVVDNTSDGIAMVDEAGAVRLWSQTLARMTGVAEVEIHGNVTKAPPIVQILINASRHPETHSDGTPAPVRLVRADGEELEVIISTVRVRAAMTSANAETPGMVSILTVHDETRERRVNRMKSDLIATVSHELLTPITPIMGYAHLLQSSGERMLPEKRSQALQIIVESSDRLARLVDDLLSASKGRDRLAIEMGDEDLDVLIRRAISADPQLTDRITVELPDKHVRVQCDRDRAQQCLANLLGNAKKYTPSDSGINVRAEVSGAMVRIHVRDHGPGIPASDRDRVFERFYRREDPLTMRTGGLGLGLHIARDLAIAMGGGLTLQTPTDGPGAEFVLHLCTTEAPEVRSAQSALPAGSFTPPVATPSLTGGDGPPNSPAGDAKIPQGSPLGAM